jgi:hypothetical protein
MSVLTIVGIVIGVFILIHILSWLLTTSKTLSNLTDAKTAVVIPASSLPESGSVNYSYSIWIYIDDWGYQYGKEKIILLRGTMGALFTPAISLMPTDNTAVITVTTEEEPFECVVPNIPLQKWTNLIVSLNNKSLDCYVNGKLVKTCVLPTVSVVKSDSAVYLTPNGGFSGYTNRLQYWNTPISPQQAWNVYKKGPGGNIFSTLLNQYKIQLNFLKGSDVQASLTI